MCHYKYFCHRLHRTYRHFSGPNLPQLIKLNEAVSCNITASGGIKDLSNIIDLKNADMYGAICGRSIYSGTLNLNDAIKECEK